MSILIKGGRVIDPAHDVDGVFDVLIENGNISRIAENITEKASEEIDASGQLVVPGLIDIHVHLRDPGLEYKEDVVSGTRAAVAGGFTAVACMPNTKPVIDDKSVALYIRRKAEEEGSCRVYPVGSITKGQKGENLTEIGELKEAGCPAMSDDGVPVRNGEVMRRALEYAAPFGAVIISHAEELSLVGDGVMNEGFVATELGLKGIPWVAEDAMVARDVMLSEFTGSRLHVAHVSTRGAVEIVRQAKKRGVPVTCEATPHHFTLTDEAVRGYNTNAKMNPPLRSAEHVEAIRDGIADGTIDTIATDHAPHHFDEKNVEFNIALNGVVGLETALALTLKLVDDGVLSLKEAISRLTVGPARALNLPGGTLEVGRAADVTVIDPELAWTVEAQKFHSKGKNTPFDGWKLKGAATHTLVDGKVAFKRES
ncbi:MAG: dihydroorotase [Desulfuromonadales bacterium]|nr:dihydroorotase [Desulfuromonadales bacterium]NIS42900.1 dihydroorotase [Desulfuromonadales bacterium]